MKGHLYSAYIKTAAIIKLGFLSSPLSQKLIGSKQLSFVKERLSNNILHDKVYQMEECINIFVPVIACDKVLVESFTLDCSARHYSPDLVTSFYFMSVTLSAGLDISDNVE